MTAGMKQMPAIDQTGASRTPAPSAATRAGVGAPPHARDARADPAWLRLTIIGIAVAFLGLFIVLPLITVFTQAFSKGAAAYVAALADPDMKAKFTNLGVTLLPGSPADFARHIAVETEKWTKVVRLSGAKIQ